MEGKTVIILILLGYLIFWYMNPEKGKALIDQGVDKGQAFIEDITGKTFGKDAPCPTTYDPVCASATTYDNRCLAQKAGELQITNGAC